MTATRRLKAQRQSFAGSAIERSIREKQQEAAVRKLQRLRDANKISEPTFTASVAALFE